MVIKIISRLSQDEKANWPMFVLLSLKGLRVGPNMKIGDADGRRSIDIPKWPQGTTAVPPTYPTGGLGSRTNEGPK